ncbi:MULTISPECIES: GNAT family N-acetyltransferase [Thermomonosporaceae]|uniref:GNAT family N-acetyltransferase n=1 Tax=Thermomonosporaceae TaxID=2012 RepID=UPI00255A96D2|nr:MULTISPECIES: GNAT family N-acetyltransferase [Thermomonosporaceae]MDL4770946.1 GNAT family N-acetyltransferase [Actinomadura xylanilytica]
MPVRQTDVTTWYLEQRDPAELRPARPPADPAGVVRAEVPSPELSRFLYTAVGGDWYWTDRLCWSYEQWHNWLDRPGVETWIAYLKGTPAGFAELDPQPDGQVEIACFGLLGAFTGRGLGGQLLTAGTARAWDLADRWPGRKPTERVWLHTCSNDAPAALRNYQARGFRVHDVQTRSEALDHRPPGPWPGAR